MNDGRRATGFAQKVLALAAIAFGLATIMAGGRVLAGADPGYLVFRPLLIYNTLMGTVYLTAGVITWRNLKKGAYAAATIFGLNLLVLCAIGVLYARGHGVAIDSLRAMTFRTGVWLVLWVGAAWLGRVSDARDRS